MRAAEILHDQLRRSVDGMHAARWSALWRVVLALIGGRKLWLTALGRSLAAETSPKHAIKAVDRLLGNRRLHDERVAVSAALAKAIVGDRGCVIVLVDTVEIRHKVVGFVASVAHHGRSLPIWSTVVKALRPNAACCRAFLDGLASVLPNGCHPVLVTDGGFESNWFEEVEARGWDYVGRVRGQTAFSDGGQRYRCKDLHTLAGRRAKNLHGLAFPMTKPRSRRLVLSKMPVSKHRRRRTRRGVDNDTNYRHYRKNAHEPLILTTSLTCSPQAVVDVYRARMQIEQNFRDLKNHRWGWSLRHCGSNDKRRVELLLMIGSIATFVQHVVGLAGECEGLQRRYQANTVRHRRVLSVFVLGGLLLTSTSAVSLPANAVPRALTALRRAVLDVAAFET